MTENSSINHIATLRKEDFGHICRCCLSRNTIANIFQLKFHKIFLVDIFKLFNTQVIWNDDLPKTICASCTATVIHFYNFKKMYDKSVATLESIARDSKKTVKKKGLLLISHEKLDNLPSLGEDVNNANSDLQNHQVPPLEEDVANANIELQKNVTTLQMIPQDSNELVENNNELLSRIYENHEILPLGDVENGDIKVEENQAIKEELDEESQNESQDHEGINDSDNNASTTILKETQISDKTIISPRKDKHKFILPYLCKACNKWITDGACPHKQLTTKKGSHVCEKCGKSYLQRAALEIHYRIHQLMTLANGDNDEKDESDDTTRQKKKRNYKCSCGETFNSSHDLSRHKKEKNHQNPLYKNCGICNKTVSYRGFMRHVRAHSAPSREKSFACVYCGLTFTLNANLKRHIKIHTGEKPHVCEFCGKGFIQKTSLEVHRRGIHTGERPFVCDFCGKSFVRKEKFMDHRRLHTGEKPYLCHQCGVAFRSSVLHNKHLIRKHRHKTADEMELNQCDICNKFYSSKECLRQHMNRHDEENKKYSCTHCKKSFHTKHELDAHLITHTGEKKFLCSLCGKAFKQMLNLKLHQSIHTGERPYTCKICFKAFRQIAHLVTHMRIHSGEKPYSCPYCDKSFAHITTRVVHVRSHTGEKPYVCDVCSKGFYHSSSMTKHRQSHFKNNVGIKMLTFI